MPSIRLEKTDLIQPQHPTDAQSADMERIRNASKEAIVALNARGRVLASIDPNATKNVLMSHISETIGEIHQVVEQLEESAGKKA